MTNRDETLKLDLELELNDEDIVGPNGDSGNNQLPQSEEILLENDDSDNFNIIIGCLEETVMGETFQNLQSQFMDKYYKQFEESEENKLEYTQIFNEYVDKIEKYVDSELKKVLPEFNMHSFLDEVKTRQTADESVIEQELMNIFLSFTDFLTFKSMVLEYKREQEGTALDFGDMLLVNGQPATPRSTGQTLAQKLGLNFGPVCQGMSPLSCFLK